MLELSKEAKMDLCVGAVKAIGETVKRNCTIEGVVADIRKKLQDPYITSYGKAALLSVATESDWTYWYFDDSVVVVFPTPERAADNIDQTLESMKGFTKFEMNILDPYATVGDKEVHYKRDLWLSKM